MDLHPSWHDPIGRDEPLVRACDDAVTERDNQIEEPGIDGVGRARDRVAELADNDLAADQEDAPDAAALARERMNAGLVPQQPPTNDAPASMSAGRKPAKVSGVMA